METLLSTRYKNMTACCCPAVRLLPSGLRIIVTTYYMVGQRSGLHQELQLLGCLHQAWNSGIASFMQHQQNHSD
jgi:hypothetical protein